jgi:hypothetical protein
MNRSLAHSLHKDGLSGSSGNRLPRSGLLFYAKAPGMVDIIGLSVSDYLLVPAEHRSIYFVDETTMRAAETIITNIEASEFLNDGGELGGSVAKGYFQYLDGTAEAILRRAYRWAGVAYPASLFGPTWAEPGTWDDNSIWSET